MRSRSLQARLTDVRIFLLSGHLNNGTIVPAAESLLSATHAAQQFVVGSSVLQDCGEPLGHGVIWIEG